MVDKAFNWNNNQIKTINILTGILMGITADGVIHDDEVLLLDIWLKQNKQYTGVYPLDEVRHKINDILADGFISDTDKKSLMDLCSAINGGLFKETGCASGLSTALVLEKPNVMKFIDSVFCFTGEFSALTRKQCEQITFELGGTCQSTVSAKLDYLVVGICNSEDWITQHYGRKIERALHLNNKGKNITIVSEETWLGFVDISSLNKTKLGANHVSA